MFSHHYRDLTSFDTKTMVLPVGVTAKLKFLYFKTIFAISVKICIISEGRESFTELLKLFFVFHILFYEHQ